MKPYDKDQYLVVTQGSAQMISEGVKALEHLTGLLDFLSTDENEFAVSEIKIWENTPITAVISDNDGHAEYGWNGDRWVKVGPA
jgi:hypothetical protein